MEQRIGHKGVLGRPIAIHRLAVMRDLEGIVAVHESWIGAQRIGEAMEDVECSFLGRELDAQMRHAGFALKRGELFCPGRARIAGEAGGESGFDGSEILVLNPHDDVEVALGETSRDSGCADVQNLGRGRKNGLKLLLHPPEQTLGRLAGLPVVCSDMEQFGMGHRRFT